MSLHRTALRLSTVLALTNGGAAPYPTVADDRVFDSRVDAIQMFASQEQLPMCVVATDDDDGKAISDVNGGPPFFRHVNLTIDMAITAMSKDASGAPLLTALVSDFQIAAMLDALEFQVKLALFGDSPWARLWTSGIKRVTTQSSKQFNDDTGSRVRFAERSLVLSVEIYDDQLPISQILLPGQAVAPPALPQRLRNILDAAATPASPYVASLTALLTNGIMPPPITYPPLSIVRLVEADAGGGKRPDGVANIVFPAS